MHTDKHRHNALTSIALSQMSTCKAIVVPVSSHLYSHYITKNHISLLKTFSGGINATVVERWTVVNRSSDRSCTRGMLHNKIHLTSPSCPLPSIALQVQNRGLKHQSFKDDLISPITHFYIQQSLVMYCDTLY